MNLDELKKNLLNMIAEHNRSRKHLALKPIKDFGEPQGPLRFFWADYWEDAHTKHTMGVTYHASTNTFHEFHDKEELDFKNVYKNFKEQMNNLPEV